MPKQDTSLLAVAGQITSAVESKITAMLNDHRLDLPADYSANNALKEAQLAVMECVDRNKRPALEVCTKESVVQSMLSMVVQGLSPNRRQCYFIVYGNKLTLFRSYFGGIAVAKRLNPNIFDITASVVYKNDTIKTHKTNGKLIIDEHTQDIMHMDKADIVGAYATVIYTDGTTESEFRTMEQIKEAWKHSARSPIDENGNIKAGTTHASETEDMCMRTVINRITKRLINTSNDASIVAQYARQTEREMEMAEAEEEISVNANTGEIIDITDDAEITEVTYEVTPDATPTDADDGEPIQMEIA